MEKFCEFFDNNIAASKPPMLSGNYGRKHAKKKQIAEALCLWTAVCCLRELALAYRRETSDAGPMNALNNSRIGVHRALLQRDIWLKHQNPYVRVVARMEQFPDEVFRRMLWFHNMDFWGDEAFLRRLSEDDISAINAAYDALFGSHPHLPVCMTEGLVNNLRRHFEGEETADDVLSLPIILTRRYKKAPAFSINFFDMDFGCVRYADAVNDHEHPTGVIAQFDGSPWVVNKEYGKYDWLFRKIRHNALWDIGDTEVREGKHLCPGIWTTLGLLAFIFISPLFLTKALFAALSPDSFGFWGSVYGLIGLPTLFVLLRAALVGCAEALISPWEQCRTWWEDVVWSRVEEKHKPNKEFWKKASEYGRAMIVGVVICVIFFALAALFYFMSNKSMPFGLVSAAFLVGHWLYGIIEGEEGKLKWMWPTEVPYVGKPASVLLPLWLLWLDGEILLSFILKNLAPILLWSIFAAYAWACVVVPKKFDEWIENDDPRGEKIDRANGIFQWVLGLMAMVTLVFAVWVIYLIASNGSFWIFFPMLATFVLAGVFSLSFFKERDPEKTYWKRAVGRKVTSAYASFVSSFASNAWVRSLDDPREMFLKVYRLWSAWPNGMTQGYFYSRMASNLNADLYALIDGYLDGFEFMGDKQKEKYSLYFFKGVSFEEAVRLVEEGEKQWKEIKQGLYWAYYYVLFGWLWGLIGRMFSWLGKMAEHAIILIETFNKGCPLVEPLDEIKKTH